MAVGHRPCDKSGDNCTGGASISCFFLRIRESLSENKPIIHIRNVQIEFPLQQKRCRISKQSSGNYSILRTEIVHWS